MTPFLSIAGKFICSSAAALFGRLGLHGLSMCLGALAATVVIIWAPVISIGPVTLWSGGYAARMEAMRDTLKQVNRDLSQCRENVSTLEASLEAQNTAIQSVSDQGQARIAESTQRLSERNPEREAAMEREAGLRDAPPVGDTLCEAVLRSLDDVLED